MCAGGVPAPASSASRSRALPNVWPEVGKSYVVGLTFASSVRTSSGLENGWVPASSKQYQTTGQDWGGAASIPASADTRRGRGSGTRPPATTRSAPAKREELSCAALLGLARGGRLWYAPPLPFGGFQSRSADIAAAAAGGGGGSAETTGSTLHGDEEVKATDRARSLEQTVLLHSSSKGEGQ